MTTADEIRADVAAIKALVEAARIYTDAREACPIGDWEARIDEAGFQVAQAYRAYRKQMDTE